MKRILIGTVLGIALGAGVTAAAVTAIVVPPGSRATVLPGGQYSTVVYFKGLDLSCSFTHILNGFLNEVKGTPMLFCSRVSTPGSKDPNATRPRTFMVSPFRFYVTDNHGRIAYQVVRAP